MALQIPRVVQSLFVQDSDATRVRDNITTALQPVLDFFAAQIQINADGTLSFLRQVALQAFTAASAKITGTLEAANIVTQRLQTAALFVKASGPNAVIIQPVDSMPVFYVTNPAGTSALFTVNGDGSVNSQAITATSLASALGIAAPLDAGFYWNTSASANTYYRTQKAVVNSANGGNGLSDFVFKFPRAGSIVGYTVNNAGPLTGQNLLGYYKNGAQIAGLQIGTGANNTAMNGAHSKGLYPYGVGDQLNIAVGNASAGNYQATVQIVIEMGA